MSSFAKFIENVIVCEVKHFDISSSYFLTKLQSFYQIPDSYASKALGVTEKVDIALARAQHKAYMEALKSVLPNVKVLPADEKYPDCVFVEDPAVIVGGHALLTKPGHPTRGGETDRMRKVLQDEFGLPIIESNFTFF